MGKPLGLFAALRFVPPFRGAFKKASLGLEKCRDFIKETIEKHEEILDVNNPKDVIDKFLIASEDNPFLTKATMNDKTLSYSDENGVLGIERLTSQY